LWDDTPTGEIERHLEHLAGVERDRQAHAARLYHLAFAWAASQSGSKSELPDVEDLYTGIARLGLNAEPFTPGVRGGVLLALANGDLGDEHLTLLRQEDKRVDDWLRANHGVIERSSGRRAPRRRTAG